MYTSVLMVALLGPGATPVPTLPARQVVYTAMPVQGVYYLSPNGVLTPLSSSGTIVYSQPTTYTIVSSPTATTPSSGTVVYSSSPVIYYSQPVYYGGGTVTSSPMTYSSPLVCRT